VSIRVTPLAYPGDPHRLFERLLGLPWPIWLDSGWPRSQRGRWDLMAADPDCRITVTEGELEVSERSGASQRSHDDPLEVIASRLKAWSSEVIPGLPCTGGALGYFGYDLGRRMEGLPPHPRAPLGIPDLAVGLYPWLVLVDHQESRAWLVEQSWAEAPMGLLHPAEPITPPAYGPRFQVLSRVGPDMSEADYAAGFARIQHYLREGDCYQVNFTQRFSARYSGEPWDAYCRLRVLNPAPFSAYFQLPQGSVLSSSPERFLKVSAGVVETRPIKGTRRRVGDASQDSRIREELGVSLKDRAENVMIVDLLRNDLGKTCRTGSVRVPQLFAVESYATVHHLVSSVTGELRGDANALDLLRGAFPGGSITGAPKRRAMQIIDEIETHRRSVYCGAIGYISASGDMDLNIAIRTLVCADEHMYCWAGGGIVLDSQMESEYQESLDKAAAMLEVFRYSEALDVGP
jgi:para-aminobenzoate synthetase component I